MSSGSGTPPWRAARATRPIGWKMASRPPGRQTRASSAKPATASKWETSPAANTAFTEAGGSGRRATSVRRSSVAERRPRRASSWSISGVTSAATTRPAGPTARRRAGPARPVPHAASRTTPPAGGHRSATAPSYAGSSSGKRSSHPAARGPKNALVAACASSPPTPPRYPPPATAPPPYRDALRAACPGRSARPGQLGPPRLRCCAAHGPCPRSSDG